MGDELPDVVGDQVPVVDQSAIQASNQADRQAQDGVDAANEPMFYDPDRTPSQSDLKPKAKAKTASKPSTSQSQAAGRISNGQMDPAAIAAKEKAEKKAKSERDRLKRQQKKAYEDMQRQRVINMLLAGTPHYVITQKIGVPPLKVRQIREEWLSGEGYEKDYQSAELNRREIISQYKNLYTELLSIIRDRPQSPDPAIGSNPADPPVKSASKPKVGDRIQAIQVANKILERIAVMMEVDPRLKMEPVGTNDSMARGAVMAFLGSLPPKAQQALLESMREDREQSPEEKMAEALQQAARGAQSEEAMGLLLSAPLGADPSALPIPIQSATEVSALSLEGSNDG